MLGIHHYWLFIATAIVLIITPGQDTFFILGRSLAGGRSAGISAALGISTGTVIHTILAALGLSALLATSPYAFMTVKFAGAAYLIYIGVRALLVKDTLPGEADAAPDGHWSAFRQGVLTNLLNPKVALFFLALLPQFIDADAPHKTLAFLFLGAWFVVQGGIFLFAFVLLVAPLRRWQAGGGWKRGLNAAGAGLFAWLAARLAFAERA